MMKATQYTPEKGRSMIKGIIFAVAACLIWGLIFVIPQFMEGYSAIEVAIGRYICYGSLSLLILCKSRLQGACRYPIAVWIKSVYFSLTCSIGYYTFVVLALRYSSPAICALVLGLSPITIAFYGNWLQKECNFKMLVLPSCLILMGLVMINAPHLWENPDPSTYILGLACCFWALVAWTWYAVANAQFLKRHPEIESSDWATMIGVATLGWVIVLSIILGLFFAEGFDLSKIGRLDADFAKYLGGCAVLGLLCSWVGGYLWNKASVYLPVSLAGQLMVFETIFGLLFVYLLEQNIPPAAECIAIVLFLAAIVYGIRSMALASVSKPEEVPESAT